MAVRIRPRTTSAALGESHAAPFEAAFTATTRLSIGVSLARKPTAPACSTAETSASSEETVSASTLMLGSRSTICRVASGPEMSGMRTSMRTTSGRSSAASRTPIFPPDACPTTSIAASALSSDARPARNRS